MRLDADFTLLILCIVAFFLTWLLTRKKAANRSFSTITSLIAAFTMPAFIPGHGEIVMVLPNAALFTVHNTFSWGAGIVFLIINYIVFTKVFGSITRKKVL